MSVSYQYRLTSKYSWCSCTHKKLTFDASDRQSTSHNLSPNGLKVCNQPTVDRMALPHCCSQCIAKLTSSGAVEFIFTIGTVTDTVTSLIEVYTCTTATVELI